MKYYIAQMCMFGTALHYCFLEPNMELALLALIASSIFSVASEVEKRK